LVIKSAVCLAKKEKLHSCSSVCLWHCNDSMQFFCTTPSCSRTIRTNSHTSTIFIAFNPWELYTQGYLKKQKYNNNNYLIARSFASAGVPVTKEPSGLFRTNGKRPDGLMLVLWQSGKSMCWNFTVICPLAESYVNGAAIEAGAATEVAASRKEAKYADIDSRYVFELIAVETLGVFNSSARLLLNELGKRISANSGETREASFFIPACLGVDAAF